MKRAFYSNPLLLALAVAPISPAFADSATDNSRQDIEEIVITASPVHGDKDKVIQGITVLSSDRLREKSAASIGETLQGELGISSASFGPGVGLPVIRGQSANRVKVMQNSLDSLDASSTSPDHASGTEALLAERIEVLRGPSTLRFGNGAIGGVVNVIDNRIPEAIAEQTNGALEVRHNSVNNGDNAVFKLDGGKGNIAWHFDGLYRSSNNISIDGPALLESEFENESETTVGFVENTDANTKSLAGGLSYVGDDGFVGFSINRQENNYGIPPGAHAHQEGAEEELVRIDMQQTRYDLRGGLSNPWQGIEQLSLNFACNNYQHMELEGIEQGTRFTNDAWESRIEATHALLDLGALGEWHGAFGLQVQQRDFAAVGEEAFVPPSDISNYGAFWLEDLQLNQWHIELGLRAEHQQIDPDTAAAVSHSTTTSSAAVQWLFADTQHLSLSVTRAERAPSAEELFSEGTHLATNQFTIGDSGLSEEASFNYELGYHYHGGINFLAFLFYNDISDFIYQRNRGDVLDELPVFVYSQQHATFKGAEAELNIPLNDHLSLNLFGDYVRAEFEIGGDVPRITPARIGSELEYDLHDWRATLRWTEVQSQHNPGNGELPTNRYSRLDTNLSYRIASDSTDYTLFLRGSNLLNEEIRDATSFLRNAAPQAGRNIELGIRVKF